MLTSIKEETTHLFLGKIQDYQDRLKLVNWSKQSLPFQVKSRTDLFHCQDFIFVIFNNVHTYIMSCHLNFLNIDHKLMWQHIHHIHNRLSYVRTSINV